MNCITKCMKDDVFIITIHLENGNKGYFYITEFGIHCVFEENEIVCEYMDCEWKIIDIRSQMDLSGCFTLLSHIQMFATYRIMNTWNFFNEYISIAYEQHAKNHLDVAEENNMNASIFENPFIRDDFDDQFQEFS